MFGAPFRWPEEGDAPFVAVGHVLDNAYVEENWRVRLVAMTKGYKKAADVAVRHAEANRADHDTLVYAIIFNYRQFIELSLKYILAVYGPMVGVRANWKTHDLVTLWAQYLKLLEEYGTPDPDEADPVVGEIVAEFAKIDLQSYSYRYPVDRNGNPIPVAHNDLHLSTLADVMQAVSNYFDGCDGFLYNQETFEP